MKSCLAAWAVWCSALMGIAGWSEGMEPAGAQAGAPAYVAVLSGAKAPSPLESSLVAGIQAALSENSDYAKMEFLESWVAFGAKKLNRSVAVIPEVREADGRRLISAFVVDAESGELLSLPIWFGKNIPAQDVIKEIVGRLERVPKSSPEKVRPGTPMVSVLSFAGESVDELSGEYLSQLLAARWISERPRGMILVDRRHISKLVEFQEVASLQKGRFLNTNMMVKGEINRLGDNSFAIARLIDIKTASVLDKAELELSSSDGDLPEIAKVFGERLTPGLDLSRKKVDEEE